MAKKILKRITLFCAVVFTIHGNAQNATFNNAGGDNLWSNTANWNTSTLPTGIATISADVTLDVDVSIEQLITPNNVEQDITISGTNTITISDGPAYIVNNRLNGVLTIGCKIVNAQSGKSIASSFYPNNQLIFANGSELTLNSNTTIRVFTANTMEFNGVLKGTDNFLVANTTNHGGIVFGSTADNSAFEGQFITYKDDIISNIESPGLLLPSTSNGIQFNNTGGSLTINKPNTVEGSISRTNTNAGTSVVTFNANQNNINALAVSATSASTILELVIDSSVTELVFNSLALNTDTNSGILNIVGFEDDVLSFGNTLTQDQLDAIQIDGVATAGFLSQRLNGHIVKTTTLNVKSNVLNNVSVHPNPVSSILYIDAPKNSEVHLFNILGAKVKSATNVSGNLEMNVTGLPAGLYILKVDLDNKSKTTKVVIN